MIRILTNLEEFLNLINTINTKIGSSPNYSGLLVSVQFRVDIQVSNFNTNNIVKVVSTLVSFLIETETFYLNGKHIYKLTSYDVTSLIEYDRFFFYFLLLGIPAFLAAILLVKFSLGLIHERRKKSLLLFRMRGVSPKFLFNALLLEMFVISLIAALISIILGALGSSINEGGDQSGHWNL